MARWHRLTLAALLIVAMGMQYLYGRFSQPQGKTGAAVPHSGAGMVTVRLEGAAVQPGIYHFPDGTTRLSAIMLTMSAQPAVTPRLLAASPTLHDGQVLSLPRFPGQSLDSSVSEMSVRERMLLDIPLDPAVMDRDDWDEVPGIGPSLAAAIVQHRQSVGGIHSVEDLENVPGISDRKIDSLRQYFR